jgi:hypothetical protein
MKLRKLSVATAGLCLLGSLALAGTHTPPSPPPCTADGGCHPAREWGIQRPRWRRWPGAESSTAARDGAVADPRNPLSDYAKPDPTEEDREAPPRVDAIERPPVETGGARDVEIPPMPEFDRPAPEGDVPPMPRAPGGESGEGGIPGIELPPVAPPTTNPLDLPPLPFGDPLPNNARPSATRQVVGTSGPRLLPPAPKDNAPPAMPVALESALGIGSSPAFAPMGQIPPAPRAIAPASAQLPTGPNAPPVLPSIFFHE